MRKQEDSTRYLLRTFMSVFSQMETFFIGIFLDFPSFEKPHFFFVASVSPSWWLAPCISICSLSISRLAISMSQAVRFFFSITRVFGPDSWTLVWYQWHDSDGWTSSDLVYMWHSHTALSFAGESGLGLHRVPAWQGLAFGTSKSKWVGEPD